MVQWTPPEDLKIGDRVRIVDVHPEDAFCGATHGGVGHEFTISRIDDLGSFYGDGFRGYSGGDDEGTIVYLAVRVLRIAAATESEAS